MNIIILSYFLVLVQYNINTCCTTSICYLSAIAIPILSLSAFKSDFQILLSNLTTIVTEHVHCFVTRFNFNFGRRTWFVLNIFEMNGQFKRDPLVSFSSLMQTYCLYTPNFKNNRTDPELNTNSWIHFNENSFVYDETSH